MAILALLFIILVLLLSIPAVQTSLGRYATKKLNQKFGTNINIERVGLKFNGDVELMDIYIEDHKADTLISIRELNTSVLSFKKLYDNKLTFGDVDIEGLLLNIKTHLGEEETNLDIFGQRFDDGKPRQGESTFLLSSSDVTISNSELRISDDNKEDDDGLAFYELDVNATDFVIRGPVVSTRINTLTFINKRGLRLKNLSTNFQYTLEDMTFENLKLTTEKSEINGSLQFSYEREDLQYFVDSVDVAAAFRDSKIQLDDLNLFYNEFGADQTVNLNTNISGTLNNLYATGLRISAPGRTYINGDITFQNLFSAEDNNFRMIAAFRELTSTRRDLRRLLPNVLGKAMPSSVEKFGTFTISGESTVTSSTVKADIDISTSLGLIYADLNLETMNNIDYAEYKGRIIMDEFDIGTFIEDPNVGVISLNLDVDGSGFRIDNINSFIRGSIYGLDYNNYYYSNILVNGNIQNKIFNGELTTIDPNIDLDFDGLVDFTQKDNNYDFVARVNYADLKALNFVTNDSLARFSGTVDMKMRGTNVDDAYGNISFKNTSYINEYDEYYFTDFAISSRFEDGKRFLNVNSPDIIEGEMSGVFKFRDIAKLIENSVGSIYSNYQPFEIDQNQAIDFNFKIYNKIVEVFYPELKLGANTSVRGHLDSDATKFRFNFRSPKITFQENFAQDIQVNINNNNPLFNTLIEVDSLNSGYYNVSDFSLINVTKQDTLFIKTQFYGGKRNDDTFDLNLFFTLDETKRSVVGFNPSNVVFKGNNWTINRKNDTLNKLIFDKNLRDFEFSDLVMEHDEESIKLSGGLAGKSNKNINLEFKDVDLTHITPEIEDLALEGNVNGMVNIRQTEGVYLPESKLLIDNFKLNEVNLGNFKADIIGNSSLTNYSVNINLTEDDLTSLSVLGELDVAGQDPSVDVDIIFDKFLLEPLNPFGDGNITNIRGEVSGKASVAGSLKRPNISGELLMDDAGMTIPYLNVDYELEDETSVRLAQQSFIFNDAILTDNTYFSRANLNGRVSHVNLSNWSLDLDLESDRLLVLNTEDSEDALYYGTAFVNGEIFIDGPTDQLVIKAEVSSEEGTVFKIPLNDSEAFGDSSFIYFLSPEEKKARLQGEQVVLRDIKGLEMDFDLNVNENAEIEIVIDKASGSTIKGRGNGGLLAQINTNGKFNMYGDFIVTEGVYNFIYGGIIQKEFSVLPGGTLVWEGDPLQAQINIRAVYDEIQANPSILLDNPINRSIPVEVEIHLTGQLEKPDPNFNLRFPNVNTTLNSELQYRLDDRESLQFQALSLLATGSFRSELNFDATDAIGLVSDRAAALLNSLISSGDGKLDVGFDFQMSQSTPEYETDSRVGVTLSTKLSERILVNGKVGVPVGGVNETVVAGDIEIEVLLNEDRTLTLKVFNRENNIRNFGEQIGYTQGIGLSYNVEFDNFDELFRRIFRGNTSRIKKRKEKENKPDEALPEFMNFKSKDTTSTRQY